MRVFENCKNPPRVLEKFDFEEFHARTFGRKWWLLLLLWSWRECEIWTKSERKKTNYMPYGKVHRGCHSLAHTAFTCTTDTVRVSKAISSRELININFEANARLHMTYMPTLWLIMITILQSSAKSHISHSFFTRYPHHRCRHSKLWFFVEHVINHVNNIHTAFNVK